MILIDTSAWAAFFRGVTPLAQAVDDALDTGEAALCGVPPYNDPNAPPAVITEIRRGLKSAQRTRVLTLLQGCRTLDEPEDLWSSAGDLGATLASRGLTVKTLDLLIATYALTHDVPLLTSDRDFRLIAKLSPRLTVLSG